jgi:NAD(P)H-dependent flavin oxidoreductase YrpB (nitropropane dioxygenase family)
MARTVLRTPLCDLLDIEYPVILAGMGGGDGFARAELAAAVSEAGGIGVIGAAGFTPDEIHEECEKVRSLTKKPFGVDILLPAGTGTLPAPLTMRPRPTRSTASHRSTDSGPREPSTALASSTAIRRQTPPAPLKR